MVLSALLAAEDARLHENRVPTNDILPRFPSQLYRKLIAIQGYSPAQYRLGSLSIQLLLSASASSCWPTPRRHVSQDSVYDAIAKHAMSTRM